MTLEPRALVHAVTLARFGSFARAAKALRVSQPALSRSVAGLEEGLGVILFDRHARGTTLTAAGEHFVRRANAILTELHHLETTITIPSPEQVSSVRVGLGPMIARLVARAALARFARDHPAVELHVSIDYGDRLVKMLRDREIELVIAGGVTFARDPDLVVVPLAPQALRTFVRADHPLAGMPAVTADDLSKYRIASVFPSGDRNLSSAYVRATLGAAPRLILANNAEVLRELVAATDAIGLEIEPSLAPELAGGRFRELSPALALPQSKPMIAWHRDRSRSDAIQRLVAYVEEDMGIEPRAATGRAH